MPTRKLYWQDSYRTSCTAQIVQHIKGQRPGVILNRTIFYPTGGGQPHDTGILADVPVVDVSSDELGQIIHWLDQPLPSGTKEVACKIDWSRRYDQMQQHSGQHLLSAAFQDVLYRPTIGFHLSENTVTIDLPGPPPDNEAIDRVLSFVQDAIARALPIVAHSYSLSEAVRLPLRKPPTVDEPVRVVEIHGLDWSACGGTHVRNTSEIGHLVITRLERRGDQTRVYFLAGGRANADHRHRIGLTRELGALLTTSIDDLPIAVRRMQEQMQQCQKKLRLVRDELMRAEAKRMIAEAPHSAGVDIVFHILEKTDDDDTLGLLLQTLIAEPNVIALLGWIGDGRPRWAAGRSKNVPLDMLESLREVKETFGVQGGGSSDMIQGSAADEETLHKVLHLLQAFAFDLPDID